MFHRLLTALACVVVTPRAGGADAAVGRRSARARDTGPPSWIGLLKSTWQDWVDDKASRLAAALAFYAVFSLAPLLVVALAVAAIFINPEDASRELQAQLSTQMGDKSAAAVQELLTAAKRPQEGITASLIGLAVLLWGASGFFAQLQDAFNTIWEVRPLPGRGVWGTVKRRFLSVVMVLGTGLLLLVSLVISTTLNAVGAWVTDTAAGPDWFTQILHEGGSCAVITLLLTLLFKFVPDADISWRDVVVGSGGTAALFVTGKWALGMYLARSSYSSAFGPAASLVLILVWIYYSAQILFLGAEFTQAYARMYGSHVAPAPGAERVSDCDRRKEERD